MGQFQGNVSMYCAQSIVPGRQPDAQSSVSLSTEYPHVLVVEDDKVACVVAQHHLAGLNCRVDLAKTGQAALTAVRCQSYDLVLLDIGLPDQDGFSVASEIRAWEASQGEEGWLLIVAVTAHFDVNQRDALQAAGIDYCLQKPFNAASGQQLMTWLRARQALMDA